MADQQRKVSLIFEANASQAKNEINGLIASLQKIQSMPTSIVDPKGIKEASLAAQELQGHIQKAINVDTGRLDMSRFSASLKSSGKDLEYFSKTLTRIGPEGHSAFQGLARSINNAEVSTMRLTKGMKDFLVTMKNTAKWQLTSSMMHGFIGAIQSATSYAKSLDASLNNIRIVTGQSVEQMSKFAVEANRSAQALSTTTTKYTDAALIFYQQGLNDKAVKERTDAVIKMANVTGEAAQEVSSYMTAIWNNFADGSKSLDYYADVITKLGAATAASSEEIAGGLEKFAAIGNTIGLSYEYATSMITTIVDKTRQSEDVVGTALKTILARIQGLNLGETLEDGTTLNKYSGALEKVGINIKDASGQLKNMDIILDELGSKWGTFSKDTQVALAQVVGGVRQYSQIISLMDNWDSFQKNVQIAEGSAGSLNEQADIYAESWEAARDRVRTAAQGIYDAIINEDVFIKLDDIFTHLLNGISGVVKGMGGMVPILGTIGGLITQRFAKEMPTMFNNMAQNLAILNGTASNKALKDQQANTALMTKMRDNSIGNAKLEAEYEALRRISVMKEKLLANQHLMSAKEIESYNMAIQNEEALGRLMVERQATLGAIEKETQLIQDQVALRTTQAQIENNRRSFLDDGEDDQYKNTKAWEDMQREEREKLEKQLNEDQRIVKMHERMNREERRGVTKEDRRRLEDANYRINKYGTRGERSQAYYDEIENRTASKYGKAAKNAAGDLVEAASIQRQKELMAGEFKELLNSDQFTSAGNKVELLKQKLASLGEAFSLAGNEDKAQKFAKLTEIITNLGDQADLTEDDIKAIAQSIDEVINNTAELDMRKKTFEDLGGTKDDTEALIKAGGKRGAQQVDLDGMGEPPEPKVEDFSSKVAIATQAVGSLMSVYGAFNAVINGWNTIMDKNATTMEKLGAAVGVAMSVMMGINNVTQLAIALQSMKSVQDKKTILHTLAKAASHKAEEIAVEGVTKSIWKQIAAWLSWMASNPIGWIMGIVAAVAALVLILSKMDRRTELQKRIDELKEESEGLAKSQEKLKETIQEVESAWENYQNAIDVLNQCTVGTEEWNEALRNVNQSVLEIIKAAPELAKFVQYTEDGQAYLGGVDYNNYIKEQARLSQLIEAQHTVVSANLSDAQNAQYVFGTQEQQLRLNEFWKEKGTVDTWDNEDQAIRDSLSTLFNEVFEGNIESFGKYLETSGLSSYFATGFTARSSRGYTAITPDRYSTGEQMAQLIANGGGTLQRGVNASGQLKDVSVNTLQTEWSNALNLMASNQVQRDLAYRDILKGTTGFNADNINLYAKQLEALVQEEKARVEGLDTTEILRQYESMLGYATNSLTLDEKTGKISDADGEIEGLTISAMQASVALGNIARDADGLVGIIAAGNQKIQGMSDYGTAVTRAGKANSGSISATYEPLQVYEAANVYDAEAVGMIEGFTLPEMPNLVATSEFYNRETTKLIDKYDKNSESILAIDEDIRNRTQAIIDLGSNLTEVPIPTSQYQKAFEEHEAKALTEEYQNYWAAMDAAEAERYRAQEYWISNIHSDISQADSMIATAKEVESKIQAYNETRQALDIAEYDAQRAYLNVATGGYADWELSLLDLRTTIETTYEGIDPLKDRPILSIEDAEANREALANTLNSFGDLLENYDIEILNHVLAYSDMIEAIQDPPNPKGLPTREEFEEQSTILQDKWGEQFTSDTGSFVLEERRAAEEATLALMHENQSADFTNRNELVGDQNDIIELLASRINELYVITLEDARAFVTEQLTDDVEGFDITALNAEAKLFEEDYRSWWSSLVEQYGESLNKFKESFESIQLDDSKGYIEQLYNYANSEAGFEALYKSINQEAISFLERIIGTTIEEFSANTDFADSGYAEKVSNIYGIVSNADSEYYADYNRESVLDMFFEDGSVKDLYKTEDGIKKFLDEFGNIYFNDKELEELDIDWALIAQRIQDSIIKNQENAFKQWEVGSDRFKGALSYDADTHTLTADENKTGGKIAKAMQDTGSLSPDNILKFMNAFEEISGGMSDTNLVKFEKSLSDLIIESNNAAGVFQAMDVAIGEAISSGKDLTTSDIVAIFGDMGIALDESEIEVQNLTDSLNTAAGSMRKFTSSVEGLIENLGSGKDVVDKLTKGGEISKEDYATIEGYLTGDQKQLFARSLGGYTYLGDQTDTDQIGSSMYDQVWDLYRQGAKNVQTQGEGINSLTGYINALESDTTRTSPVTTEEIAQWMFRPSENGTMAFSEDFRGFSNAYGLGDNNFTQLLSNVGNGNISVDDQGQFTDTTTDGSMTELISMANELVGAISGFIGGEFKEGSIEAQQVAMTSAGSSDELIRRVSNGDIKLGGAEGDGIPLDQYYEFLDMLEDQEFSDKLSTLGIDAEEVENLGKTLGHLAEDFDDNIEGSEELSGNLAVNEDLAKEVAKELVRYDRALESVTENQEEWTEALESKNPVDMAKAIGEMDEAYSDMLDLDPGTLSQGFLENADNLELMKKAAKGSEEAYNQLQEAAGKDILMQVGVDTARFDTDKAWIDSQLMELSGVELDDIEVGTALNNTEFLNGLTEMVNAAGMTASQAEAYLGSMGVDAKVIEHPVETEETVATNVEATPTTIEQPYSVPSATDPSQVVEMISTFPTVTYNTVPVTATKKTGATTLEVVTASKSSGGEFKHQNSSNGTGRGSRDNRRRGGGGGGGRRPRRGGGGGGGGSRAPTADKKKNSEKERYRTIQNQLEDLTDSYDKVSKSADRAFGKARVLLLRDQQKELKKLASAQKDYIDEINAYYKQDLSNLDKVSAFSGVKIELDKNGTITNYDAIQDAMWADYNSHINEAGEVTGMDEEAWKKYEEEWEEVMGLIEQYEETQDLRKEALQQLQDYINDIYDLQLEEVTYSVEVNIDSSEYALEILDYLLGKIEDDAWEAAEAINYMGKQAEEFLEQSDIYTSGIRGILENHTRDITDANGDILQKANLTQADVEGFMNGDKNSIEKIKNIGLSGGFTDEEVQTLKDYHSQLISTNQSLLDLRESVFDKVLEAFESFNEELEKGISKLEHLSNITQAYRDIVDLVGKDNLGISDEFLRNIGQGQVEQSINILGANKNRRDTLETMVKDAEAKRDEAIRNGYLEDEKLWNERIETMKEQLDEAEEAFMDSWNSALEAMQAQFELHMGGIIETLSDALAGPMGKSLDELQDAFNRTNELAEMYLPDYEKIYELNKLNRDITNSIDETDNVKAKQELAELQAEINELEKDGVQVSQYQTEDLRRRYELKLAEIALNEAQNTKSQVQMTRSADGNWSYVYTADEEDVAAAEQSYEDRLFALQQANADYINQMQEMLIQAETDLVSKIEEITSNQALSMEEQQAMIDEVTAHYTEKFSGYAGELELVLDNNAVLYENDWTLYSERTGYKISADEEYVDRFNETALKTLTGFTTIEGFHQNFLDASKEMLDASSEAYESWGENLNRILEEAGTDVQDFAEDFDTQVQNAIDDSERLSQNIKDTGSDIEQTFADITTAVSNWESSYTKTIDTILEKNTALATSFNTVLASFKEFQVGTGVTDTGTGTGEGEGEGGEGEGNENGDSEAMGQITIQKGYQYWGYKSPKGGDKNRVKVVNDDRKQRTYKFTQMDTSTRFKRVYIPSEGVWVSSYDPNGPKRIKVEKFDTGGYTGAWGSEGRMAMLHEKELVLNKQDTSNLLNAVSMIRQIASVIDLNAYSSAGFGGGMLSAGRVGSTGTLEQVVHVTAEFPNATNREEIYAAFGDIVNLASQYANR